MTLRITPLLGTLSPPMLAAAGTSTSPPMPSPPPPSPIPVMDPNPLPTQSGTRELPPRYTAPAEINAKARFAYWSEQAWRSAAIDVSPPPAGPYATADERGRTRTSRVMAIFHIASMTP